MEVKLVCDFSNRHSVGEILFVGQNEESSIAQLIFPQHLSKFFSGTAVASINALPVVGVNHEDDGVGILVVVAPERSDLVLTSNIPRVEEAKGKRR